MKIKTYKGKLVQEPHFFILNKGMNTGSPNFKPYANCFVLTTETMKELNFYYWLCFALWQTRKFIPCLVGSVVPFIHIRDLKAIIAESEIKVKRNEKEYRKNLSLLIEMDSKGEELAKQLKKINELKRFVLKKVLQ